MNAVRVSELFREWDDDQTGKLSREEFTRGLRELGFEAGDEAIHEVFDTWDRNGSGVLELREVEKQLGQGSRLMQVLDKGAELMHDVKDKGAGLVHSAAEEAGELTRHIATGIKEAEVELRHMLLFSMHHSSTGAGTGAVYARHRPLPPERLPPRILSTSAPVDPVPPGPAAGWRCPSLPGPGEAPLRLAAAQGAPCARRAPAGAALARLLPKWPGAELPRPPRGWRSPAKSVWHR